MQTLLFFSAKGNHFKLQRQLSEKSIAVSTIGDIIFEELVKEHNSAQTVYVRAIKTQSEKKCKFYKPAYNSVNNSLIIQHYYVITVNIYNTIASELSWGRIDLPVTLLGLFHSIIQMSVAIDNCSCSLLM